jgi:hypothetical protein
MNPVAAKASDHVTYKLSKKSVMGMLNSVICDQFYNSTDCEIVNHTYGKLVE